MRTHLIGFRYLAYVLNVSAFLWAVSYLGQNYKDPWSLLGFLAGFLFLYQLGMVLNPVYGWLAAKYYDKLNEEFASRLKEELTREDNPPPPENQS